MASDSTIIAEGRLEPIRYAEIAFTASGRISNILVEEGQTVTAGEELIRLGDASDTHYAAAQLELVSVKKALTALNNTAGTDSAQAYNLYLMARQQWIWGSWGNSRRDEVIVRICTGDVWVRSTRGSGSPSRGSR